MNNSQLLENLLLTGTPQDAAEFFADHRNDVDAQRALAIAYRFCGLEYVKALAESGAVFKESGEQPYYWLACWNYIKVSAKCIAMIMTIALRLKLSALALTSQLKHFICCR